MKMKFLPIVGIGTLVFSLLASCSTNNATSHSSDGGTNTSTSHPQPTFEQKILNQLQGELATSGTTHCLDQVESWGYVILDKSLQEQAYVNDEKTYAYQRELESGVSIWDAIYLKDDEGYMYQSYLTTLNTVENVYMTYSSDNSKIKFDELAINPFNLLNASNLIVDDVHKTISISCDNEIFELALSWLVCGYEFDVASTTLSYDEKGNVTRLEVVSEVMQLEEWGPGEYETIQYEYAGNFVTAEELNLPSIPQVMPHKEEHDALNEMFEKLQQNNYYFEYSLTPFGTGDWTGDYYGTVTPTGMDLNYGEKHRGWVETDDGLVPYTRAENNGKYVMQYENDPYQGTSLEEQFLPSFDTYAAEVFTYEGDGVYRLTGNSGLYVADSLKEIMVDSMIETIYPSISDGQLTFTLNDDDTLTIKYRSYLYQFDYEAIISKIGTATFPYNQSEALPFVAPSSWNELDPDFFEFIFMVDPDVPENIADIMPYFWPIHGWTIVGMSWASDVYGPCVYVGWEGISQAEADKFVETFEKTFTELGYIEGEYDEALELQYWRNETTGEVVSYSVYYDENSKSAYAEYSYYYTAN